MPADEEPLLPHPKKTQSPAIADEPDTLKRVNTDGSERILTTCAGLQFNKKIAEDKTPPTLPIRAEDRFLTFYSSAFTFLQVQGWETIGMISMGTLSLFLMEHFNVAINLSWTFVSIVIVFPLTATIGMAFKRREEATGLFADITALIHGISLAHRDWHCSGDLPEGHSAATNHVLKDMITDLQRLLQGPLRLPRDLHCPSQAKLQTMRRMDDLERAHLARFLSGIRKLSKLTEEKKAAGMPSGEASRINQYVWMLQSRFQKLRNVKKYRTPQILRSLSRVFIIVTPAVFAPSIRYIKLHSGGGWPFACAYALFLCCALVSLLHVANELEDPFDNQSGVTDDVKVDELCAEARAMLDLDEDMVLSLTADELSLVEYSNLDSWCCC